LKLELFFFFHHDVVNRLSVTVIAPRSRAKLTTLTACCQEMPVAEGKSCSVTLPTTPPGLCQLPPLITDQQNTQLFVRPCRGQMLPQRPPS